jgi:hypothetical protein
MGNTFTTYDFDTSGDYVSGIARAGTEQTSEIVGFYISKFGQTSQYEYKPRTTDGVLNTTPPIAELNVLFPAGWFLSGIQHYQKSTKDSTIVEDEIHYMITDGYVHRAGFVHRQNYHIDTNALETAETHNRFECSAGEYVAVHNASATNIDQVRSWKHKYNCLSGGPRPIPAAGVGVIGVMGPRGWHGEPGPPGSQGPPGSHDASDTNKANQQMNLTGFILFLVIVYVIVWVSPVGKMIGTIGGTVSGGGDAVGGLFTDVGEFGSDTIGGIGDVVGSAISNVGNTVGGMVSGAGHMAGNIIGGTTAFAGDAVASGAGIVGGGITGGGSAIDGIVGGCF